MYRPAIPITRTDSQAPAILLVLIIAAMIPFFMMHLLEQRDGGLRAMIAAATVFPAILLAFTRSTFLLDYFLIVVAFNREVRRVMDWMMGEYDPKPLMSVTPMAISLLLLVVAVSRYASWPKALQRGGIYIAVGLAYSMALGLKYKFGAVYGLMDYVMPFSVLFFCASSRPDEQTITRWMRTLGTLGVIVAAYGVIQWALVPPWDAQWIMWSGMWSSMGLPEPFKIGIASTLESRGPAAWFMANAAVVMIAVPKWRKPWGWIGPAFVSGVLLLTTVRSSWGFVVGAVIFFSILQRGRAIRQLWILGASIAVMAICVPYLPESELIQNRVATLSSIHEDSSFQGRVNIAQQGFGMVLTKPQGFGMGSSGNGGKLIEGGADGIGDNGYLSLLADLGVPGFTLFALGLSVIVKYAWKVHQKSLGKVSTTVGLAMIGSSLVFLLIFNTFTSAHASYMWVALSSSFSAAAVLAHPAKKRGGVPLVPAHRQRQIDLGAIR